VSWWCGAGAICEATATAACHERTDRCDTEHEVMSYPLDVNRQKDRAKRHGVAGAVGNAIAADASWRVAPRADDSAKRRAR
jgi:hypothetical protein